jgi:hypothetical protein
LQTQKRELIGELNSKTVAITIDDIGPMGIHLSTNAQGTFSGKFSAGHIETTTSFQKVDGTLEWETKAIETTSEGDTLIIKGSGSGKVTGPTVISWEGEFVYMTKSPKLDWLNRTKGWAEGTIDRAKNKGHAKVYALK